MLTRLKISFNSYYTYLFISIFSIYQARCQQSQYKENFKKEIIEVCPICSIDKESFDILKTNDFHNAHVLFSRGDYDTSLITITKISSRRENENKKMRFILYTIKGRILNKKQLYQEALQNLDSALVIGKSIQSPYIDNLYSLSGQMYLDLEEYEKGITILEEWKTSYKGSTKESANLHNLGLCYLHLNNFVKAEENLLESYALNKQRKDTLELAMNSLNIAVLYYEQYKDSLAIAYFEKGLEYSKQAGDLKTLKNAYDNLAVVEENREDYKKALSYRKEFEKIKDSIWNRDQIWKLAQRDKEVTVAVKEEIIKTEQWKKKGYALLAASFLLFLIIGGFFMYKIKKQQKVILAQKQRLNDLNNTKDTLFSVLTHDLKMPIHGVQQKLFQLFTATQKATPKNTEYTALVSESYHVSKKTAGLLDNVLHWVLASKDQLFFNKEKITITSIIEQVIYDYMPILEARALIFTTSIDPSHSVYADRNMLKIVLRNLIDNAIKFSPPGKKISVTSQEEGAVCTIHIKDQGIGFSLHNDTSASIPSSTPDTQGKTSTGLGLQLCKQLLEKNKGSMLITSVPNEGTEVVLTLDRYT